MPLSACGHAEQRAESLGDYRVAAFESTALSAYSYALKHLDMAVVSLYSYVNPIIAVVLGSIVLGEPFNARMAVAIAIIAVGVIVVGPLAHKS